MKSSVSSTLYLWFWIYIFFSPAGANRSLNWAESVVHPGQVATPQQGSLQFHCKLKLLVWKIRIKLKICIFLNLTPSSSHHVNALQSSFYSQTLCGAVSSTQIFFYEKKMVVPESSNVIFPFVFWLFTGWWNYFWRWLIFSPDSPLS